MSELATLNRAQRRALEKAAKKPFKRPSVADATVMSINPLFALNTASGNRLARTERVALDALLEHRATADNMGELDALIEASIRAIGIAQREGYSHLDADGLAAALKAFHRAAWALKHARSRHETSGVYGLDAADRAALIEADQLVGEMRKPGVLLRKTWLIAFRDACRGRGVPLMSMEECAA